METAVSIKKSFYRTGAREIMFLGFNVLFNKVIALLFIPFIQAKLGAAAYVQYDYYLTFLTVGTALFILGIDSGIVQFLHRDTERSAGEKFTRALTFGVTNIGLLSSGSMLLYALLHWGLGVSLFVFNDPVFVLFVVLNTVVLSLQSFFYAVLRWMGKSHIASVGNILIPVSGIIPSVVYFFGTALPSINTFLLVNFLGGLAGLLCFVFFLKRWDFLQQVRFSVAEYRQMFSFSFPLGVNSLLFNSVRYSDRFILAYIFGAAGVNSPVYADYLLVQRLGQFVASVLQLVGAAFMPMIFEQSKTEEGRKKIRSFQHVMVLSHIPVLIVGAGLFYFWQHRLIGNPEFVYFFPLSLIGFFALSDMTSVGLGFFKGNKTKEVLYISLAYLVVNSVLEIVVGRLAGIQGIFVSNCLVAIVYSFVYCWRSEKHFKVGYNFRLLSLVYFGLLALSGIFLVSHLFP